MDWTEIKVVWFQEPQQYFFGNWAKRAWTISLLSLGSINRLSEGTRETKKERRCWYCSKITPIFCPGNGPSCPYWYDLPILFNSMQKTSSLSKSWLENKMKQMGPRRDKLHKILLHSMPIRLFQLCVVKYPIQRIDLKTKWAKMR